MQWLSEYCTKQMINNAMSHKSNRIQNFKLVRYIVMQNLCESCGTY